MVNDVAISGRVCRVRCAWILGGLSALVMVTARPVSAQDDDTSNRAMARQLFNEGIELGEQERWEEAVDRFSRAYDLRPSPGIAVNLASALIPLGELVEASELLQELMDDEETPDNVLELAATLFAEEIEGVIAELTIVVDDVSDDLEVYVNDNPIPPAAWGVGIPANPGETVVEAMLDGDVVATETLTLERGGSQEVDLEIELDEETERRPNEVVVPGSDSDSSVFESPWFWTILGVVVAAGVGVTLGFVLGGSSEADPVAGNTNPPFLEGMVMP